MVGKLILTFCCNLSFLPEYNFLSTLSVIHILYPETTGPKLRERWTKSIN